MKTKNLTGEIAETSTITGQRMDSHRFMRRTTVSAVALVLCAMVSTVAVPSMASAVTEKVESSTAGYVALGDSYAAGQGSQTSAADLIASSGDCARYTTAYPNLWSAKSPLHLGLSSQACSGATVSEVGTLQLPALKSTTSLVTLTVGGNDVGFVPVVVACAQQPAYCQAAVQGSAAAIKQQLPTQLAALYRGIKASAPNARLVVLGYPKLFGTGRCTGVGQVLSATTRQQLDGLSDQLNAAIASVAKTVGASFVDVRPAFAGHGVCGTLPWINGLGPDQSALLHPNTAGQQAYASALTATVAKITIGVPPRFSAGEPRKLKSAKDQNLSRSFAPAEGTKPITYSIVKGSLPTGVKFNPRTGVISGTPSMAGRFKFTWSAANVYGTATSEYRWTVK